VNRSLVQKIIEMINLREREDVTAFFIHEIDLLTGVSDIQLFQETKTRALTKPTDNTKYERIFNKISNKGIVAEEPIDNFLSTYSIKDNLESRKETVFVYPIEINNESTKLLHFISNDLSEENQFAIQSLCDVFKNQIQLLLSGEMDALTGLRNRTSFERVSEKIFSGNSSTDKDNLKQSCFSILDIDHFKKVNDDFGHLYGDEVLLLFAKLMKKQFRTSDYLFRYGGEEFAVILTDCLPKNAHETLERFRQAASDFRYPQVGQKTVSIGYTILKPENGAPLTIDQADQALYYSKEHGRNKTTSYMDLKGATSDEQDVEMTVFFDD